MAQESASDLERRLALAQRELSETRERQAATAEVLGIIASSPGELEPVFQAILANATRICEAKFGTLFKFDGEGLMFEAELGMPQRLADYLKQRQKFKPLAGSTMERLVETRQVVHVHDVTQADGLAQPLGNAWRSSHIPRRADAQGERAGWRHCNLPTGGAAVHRQADRAGAELRRAGRHRHREHPAAQRAARISLQQQTATSDVLQVISSSPGELEPVFQAMLANATRICEAKFGVLFRYEDGFFYPAATLNPPPALADFLQRRGRFLPAKGTALDTAIKTKKVVHIDDDAAQEVPTAPARFGGARSYIAVPMLKEDELIGAIVIYRQEVRPFTDKQIELVTNFAAQAVIAIENTRLLNELRQRTDDLSEALEQQTATSEVLQVISSSPGELEPVFQAMLANATRICEAKFGILWLCEGGGFRAVALHGRAAAHVDERRRDPSI